VNATHKARLTALFAKAATPALVEALRTLEAKRTTGRLDQFELMSRAWTIDELERRFPAASDAVEAAMLEAETTYMAGGEYTEVDYVGVLLAHIPAGGTR
jgi:hypothetical protein